MTVPAPSLSALVFVNRFQVHGASEDFEKAFDVSARILQTMPGYLWHALLRCSDGDPYDYMNVACWTNEDSFFAAVASADFNDHSIRLREVSTSEPAVCRTVSVGTPMTVGPS